jgi:large subunit ribosomal protein L25
MTATKVLNAEARQRVGKGAARALRRDHKIPAVIYGEKRPPLGIAISGHDLYVLLKAGGFMTTVFEIAVDGATERVIPRDFQVDPVRDVPIHVDFLRVGKDTMIEIDVPVHFKGQDRSPGIKRGGVLNIVRHSVELYVSADAIPEAIEVDLSGLDINDSVHISAVSLPAGARPVIRDRDFTIATVAAPTVMRSEAEETAAAAGEQPAEGGGEEPKEPTA